MARLLLAALALSAGIVAVASGQISAALSSALADSHRPTNQRQLDSARKPAEVLAYAGVAPGNMVADFMPGNAYFTRILSKLVGSRGRVYAFIPQEQVQHCDPSEIAGSRAIETDPIYQNVVHLQAPVDQFAVPQKLDVILTTQNYHDLHDSFLGSPDIARVNRNFFNALKPGGVLLVVDHVAASGAGLAVTETLHRIDPATVRAELETSGFIFDGELDVLRRAADDHSMPVFDPAVRGKTDQFIYRFERPRY